MGALQVPLGSFPEPLIVVFGASKTQKVWFLHWEITLFVNAVFQYFEALDVRPWSRSGPEMDPKMEPKITQKLAQNRFQTWISFFNFWTNWFRFGPWRPPPWWPPGPS